MQPMKKGCAVIAVDIHDRAKGYQEGNRRVTGQLLPHAMEGVAIHSKWRVMISFLLRAMPQLSHVRLGASLAPPRKLSENRTLTPRLSESSTTTVDNSNTRGKPAKTRSRYTLQY
jgi:hypothetical protein